MRPRSILMFERLYLASIVLSVAGTLLAWPALSSLAAQSGSASAGPALVMALVIGTIIPLLIWYFVARRGSVVAKWLCIALFAIGFLAQAAALARGMLAIDLPTAVTLLVLLLRLGAAAMLLQPDARAWFRESRS